jgi:hypothetical protein
MGREESKRSLTFIVVGAALVLGLVAALDAFRSSDSETAVPTTTDEGESESAATAPPAITRVDASQPHRLSRTSGGVRFSFVVRTVGWEEFGRISLNKSIVGPQGAEAIIFWASIPPGRGPEPCTDALGSEAGRSAADVADSLATAAGTELVRGPVDVTLDGRPAKHVVLTVRELVGCDPGFFYEWEDEKVGALWPETHVGDTVRVWVAEVDGTRFLIEAETSTDADAQLEEEVDSIVRSIRFD